MANNYTDASIWPPLPASQFGRAEIKALKSSCNVVCHRKGDRLHLLGKMYFTEVDEEYSPVNLLAFLLQEKLWQLDADAYPHIIIHGVCICHKKRPDEFGGYACVITRDQIRSMSTWEWLATQTAGAASQDGGQP
jgi:hypothetical protein